MDYTPEKIAEFEEMLRTLELISASDRIVEVDKGDYWEKILCFYSQVRGTYYYTEEAVCFVGGFAGSTNWSVKYKDIKKIEKCLIGFFMPFGIRVHYYDEKKDKIRKHKMSVLKRDRWIALLTERSSNLSE
ncbi:MAG: hypothetical protein K6F79_06100 [Saccharofermentans sp.]|nr:hypothetical protein [Saccharofermentans sp.]